MPLRPVGLLTDCPLRAGSFVRWKHHAWSRRSTAEPPRMNAQDKARRYTCHVPQPRPAEPLPAARSRSDTPPAATMCRTHALDDLHRVQRRLPKRRVIYFHQQITHLDIVPPMAQPVVHGCSLRGSVCRFSDVVCRFRKHHRRQVRTAICQNCICAWTKPLLPGSLWVWTWPLSVDRSQGSPSP